MITINVSEINQELYWQNRSNYRNVKYGMGPAYDKVLTSLFYQREGRIQVFSIILQESYDNDKNNGI
jgi:hypothetical protein